MFRLLGLLFLYPALTQGTPALESIGHPSIGKLGGSIEEIKKRTQKELLGAGDIVKRTVKRLGDKTLELESFANIDADYDTFWNITKEFQNWNDWVLKDINKKPEGGEYYAKILRFENVPNLPQQLKIFLLLDFPVYKKSLVAHMDLLATRTEGHFTLQGKLAPKNIEEAIIPRCEVTGIFFETDNPNRIQAYIKGWMVLKPWVLYQALPKKLLTKEAGNRVRRVIDNYMELEISRERAALSQ